MDFLKTRTGPDVTDIHDSRDPPDLGIYFRNCDCVMMYDVNDNGMQCFVV